MEHYTKQFMQRVTTYQAQAQRREPPPQPGNLMHLGRGSRYLGARAKKKLALKVDNSKRKGKSGVRIRAEGRYSGAKPGILNLIQKEEGPAPVNEAPHETDVDKLSIPDENGVFQVQRINSKNHVEMPAQIVDDIMCFDQTQGSHPQVRQPLSMTVQK